MTGLVSTEVHYLALRVLIAGQAMLSEAGKSHGMGSNLPIPVGQL